MDISEEPFGAVIYRKTGPVLRGRRLVRASAVEMHLDISEERLFAAIYRKKCRTLFRPPRLNTGPFTLTVRTPSVWPRCLGKNVTILLRINSHKYVEPLRNSMVFGDDDFKNTQLVEFQWDARFGTCKPCAWFWKSSGGLDQFGSVLDRHG